MQMQTLEELKRENAAADQPEVEQPQLDDEVIEADAVDTEAEEVAKEAETEAKEPEEVEAESWMIGDDEASQSNEEQTIPLKAHIKQREKLKSARDDLRKELDEVKAQLQAKPQTTETPVVNDSLPKLEDYDFDEGKYAQAMAEHNNKVIQKQLESQQQQVQQQAAIQAQKAVIDKSVDQHYSRAETMIKNNGISPDVYKASELKVREMANAVFPGQGDDTIESLIDTIGEGSEKVIYALGRNSNMLAEFESALRSNPLKAVAFASKKAAEFNLPSKRKSMAPKPSKQINSGTATTGNSAELKKYKEAHKSGNSSKAFSIKMAAKKSGLDTTQW